MTVFAVTCGKGGSGKSTTAAELTLMLARAGNTVIGVDLDEQHDLTTRVGVTKDTEIFATATDVVKGEATLSDAAVPAPAIDGGYIAVATHELGTLTAREVPDLMTGLRDHLRMGGLEADHMVLDCPATLENLTLTALAAADVVIGTIKCEMDSLEKIAKLEQQIASKIALRARPEARLHYVLPTQYDSRRVLDQRVLARARQLYPDRVLQPIRQSTIAGQAFDAGAPVGVYRPGSELAADYVTSLGPIVREHAIERTRT